MSPETVDLQEPCDNSMENNERRYGSYGEHEQAATEDANSRHPSLPEAVAHGGGSIAHIVHSSRTSKTCEEAEDRQENTREERPIKGREPTHESKGNQSENDRMYETERMKNGISQERGLRVGAIPLGENCRHSS